MSEDTDFTRHSIGFGWTENKASDDDEDEGGDGDGVCPLWSCASVRKKSSPSSSKP